MHDRLSSSLAAFAEASRSLIGVPLEERSPWNTIATPDAIRHFAFCIGDDNPLWVDSDYAKLGPHGRLAAPPTFLFSVLYPVLHGAPVEIMPTFLISDLDCQFYRPILAEDVLSPTSILRDVLIGVDRAGRSVVYLVSKTEYHDSFSRLVGSIETTLAVLELAQGDLLLDREVHSYTHAELEAITSALRNETRTGSMAIAPGSLRVGDSILSRVRGPLTIGDLICWHAAIGPPYRGGRLAYLDLLDRPHTATTLPRVGWPVRYSQQHEDARLSMQRGMPAPFDNTTMRAAWLGVIVTDWMGDHGILKRLRMSATRPVLYGDVTRYVGRVNRLMPAGDYTLVELALEGRNQLGEVTTTANAEVALPRVTRTSLSSFAFGASQADAELAITPLEGSTASELLQAAAFSRPNSPAVQVREELLSHRELAARVNQMSRALLAKGVRPGTSLGLHLNRSLDAVVLILACARAGAAAVPLDGSSSPGHLARILEVAKPTWLLDLSGGLAARVPSDVISLSLDELNALAARHLDMPPDVRPALTDPAYVLFTSGSRGEPQPVAISHGGLGSYLRALSERLELSSEEVFLQTASLAFSAAVRQFWLPLVQGACLVMADEETRRRPDQILKLIRSRKITVWDTVPSLLSATLDYLQDEQLAARSAHLGDSLRRLNLTGEPLDWRTVRACQRVAGPGITILNLYGQTETGGTVCVYDVAADPISKFGTVPLGKPLGDIAIAVLGADGNVLPSGQEGVIVVGGMRFENACSMKGKWDSPDAIFVNVDSLKEPIILSTGDLGLLRDDGNLISLGRGDDLVKLRGYRVRLGEVELVLKSNPAVGHVALVHETGDHSLDDSRLIAYWVPQAGAVTATAEQLRSYLTERLPEYMVPAVFVKLQALPLNANGKFNRMGLPTQPRSGDPFLRVAPSTDIERQLHADWTEVLGHSNFGIIDNFFAIGGHSLAAARLVSRLENFLSLDLSPTLLFAYPTVRSLAERLDQLLDEALAQAERRGR